jgi:hypothetical protein
MDRPDLDVLDLPALWTQYRMLLDVYDLVSTLPSGTDRPDVDDWLSRAAVAIQDYGRELRQRVA